MSAIKKVLVANRGEIACRVFDTCRRMGIQTVAIFSEKDAEAKHVRHADEAYCVGPAESALSYLDMTAILEAVQKSGACAVHPGYGFLSENADFSAALEDMGVSFLGPDRLAIEAMGDKIESKRIAGEAGVNIIPGFEGEVDTAEEAVKIAGEVGYPIMLKASAGGGGKGMRVANNDEETMEGFRLARDEALSSFGDDRILIERFVERPRHIEIQVLLDRHGNGIYLNERECSVQRRNQKVLEEAPSVFLDEITRQEMGKQALQLARAVEYCSAGTVEFLVDPKRNFYFLEMNTRLQVEHPVTELITGVDLVEQMIRVGAGQKLTVTQEDIPAAGSKGWAVEARVYAENPSNNFLPSIGRVLRYEEPAGEGVRVDSGITEGSEISVYYDPMISKLIGYAPTRDEACEVLRNALDEYVIRGVQHNTPFLRSCLNNERFLSGELTTAFIEEEFPEGFSGQVLSEPSQENLRTIIAAMYCRDQSCAAQADGGASSLACVDDDDGMLVSLSIDHALVSGPAAARDSSQDEPPVRPPEVVARVRQLGDDLFGVRVGESDEVMVELDWASEALQYATIGDDVDCAHVVQLHSTPIPGVGGGTWEVQYQGAVGSVKARPVRTAELEHLMPLPAVLDTYKYVISPMPGSLVSLAVQEGSEVVEGQEVGVLEAMKMQNVIRAERSGVVKSIAAKVGDTLQADDIIIEFAD